jgi:DnaK suppressor protein
LEPRDKFGEVTMDHARAKALLEAERRRLEDLLSATRDDSASDGAAANETGDMADPAERLTAEEIDDAVAGSLQDRLAAIGRAQTRLADGGFGLSVRSGRPIPDERLEADPAAELTVDEATEAGPRL